MADRHRPTPAFQQVREGNSSKVAIKEGVIMPRAVLAEPNWSEVFKSSPDPAVETANIQCREVAPEEWRRVVPVLEVTAGTRVGAVSKPPHRYPCARHRGRRVGYMGLSTRGLRCHEISHGSSSSTDSM